MLSRLLSGCWVDSLVTHSLYAMRKKPKAKKDFRENSLLLHGRDEHSRDASTCSRLAGLSSSGAQHDKGKNLYLGI